MPDAATGRHVECACPSRTPADLTSAGVVGVEGCPDRGHVLVSAVSVKGALFDQARRIVGARRLETVAHEAPNPYQRGSWVAALARRRPSVAHATDTEPDAPLPEKTAGSIAMDLTAGAVGHVEVVMADRSQTFDSPGQILFAIAVANRDRSHPWPKDWHAIVFHFSAGIAPGSGGSFEHALHSVLEVAKVGGSSVASRIGSLGGVPGRLAALAGLGPALVALDEWTGRAFSGVVSSAQPLVEAAGLGRDAHAAGFLSSVGLRQAYLVMLVTAARAVSQYVRRATGPGRTWGDTAVDVGFGAALLAVVLPSGLVWAEGTGFVELAGTALERVVQEFGVEFGSWILSLGEMAFMIVSLVQALVAIGRLGSRALRWLWGLKAGKVAVVVGSLATVLGIGVGAALQPQFLVAAGAQALVFMGEMAGHTNMVAAAGVLARFLEAYFRDMEGAGRAVAAGKVPLSPAAGTAGAARPLSDAQLEAIVKTRGTPTLEALWAARAKESQALAEAVKKNKGPMLLAKMKENLETADSALRAEAGHPAASGSAVPHRPQADYRSLAARQLFATAASCHVLTEAYEHATHGRLARTTVVHERGVFATQSAQAKRKRSASPDIEAPAEPDLGEKAVRAWEERQARSPSPGYKHWKGGRVPMAWVHAARARQEGGRRERSRSPHSPRAGTHGARPR